MRECRPVFVGREKSQFDTSSTGPILLDQFGTNSTGPIWHQFYWTNLAPVLLTLLAYDFFLNF
jgi:hypothetical protein